MNWSPVSKKHRKPLMWWYHKILCEFFYSIRNEWGDTGYYRHLDGCLKQGFTLYGEKV